ncbi:cell division site-positioning protein MapZ family protein [uncultured Streptococcus sp.]|uniref:cell division site-positioning protein MapZ n=1 Tax=uncultured Streptococcus sp. TaxID=83427 RepID=UPI0028D83980|nr:cell division site-positioning protein MapZ family protein [uncultured Streptococcus sp.]
MGKKRRDRRKTEYQELQYDFDEAKELTVGQAMRKNEEVKAGVLASDSILDKYVKQHKDEIEADKFSVRQEKKEELVETQSLDELIQEVRESQEGTDVYSEEVSSSEEITTPLFNGEDEKGMDPLVVVDEFLSESSKEVEDNENLFLLDQNDSRKSKKKIFFVLVSLLLTMIICVGAYYVYRQVSRSTKEIQTSQSTSNSQADSEEFNNLYDAFYTDINKTALKNSQFDQLSKLKSLLDKLEGSREYALSKSKYDSLASQIKAVQDVNALFETPVLTDGVVDTNAKAKKGATFTETKTGNTELDKLLNKAISLGKSQQTTTSSSSKQDSSSQVSSTASSETSPSTSNSSSNERREASSEVNMGLSSAGISLQRSVSRVPYNQSAIDDSGNSAWEFSPGVLEKILETSRSRGYITGNQYILERVNIVNGNGYYNLYKPDGTYLFTLNCKTGYFVGNGSGHADALDY